MDVGDVKELLNRVEKIAQCPVCLEIVSPPVLLCVNGHLTCGQCRNGARNCHICRRPYSDVSARAIEQLLSTMPKPCPQEECEAISITEDHHKYCMFRPIMCRLGQDLECDWSGTVKQWLDHANQRHPKTTYQFGIVECQHFRNFLGDWRARCYHHSVGEEHFLSHIWKKGNKIYHSFRHVQCGKPKNEFVFMVSYKCGGRVLYKSLIETLPFENDELMHANPAVFYADDLHGVVDVDGKLSVFVEAIKKPLPGII